MAGFGKGGTSLSFWENVYGFDMQSVGEEVLYDATLHPIIDVINAKDVITDSCLIKVKIRAFVVYFQVCSHFRYRDLTGRTVRQSTCLPTLFYTFVYVVIDYKAFYMSILINA